MTAKRIRLGNPFEIDWDNQEQVIKYAQELGSGNAVIKFKDRSNYNIAVASNLNQDKYIGVDVIWLT